MILIGIGYWRPPIYVFLHDCPFKGLGSLPESLDLTPRCQIDSPLHHAAVRFDCRPHHAAVRFDSPLHHAAERFDSLLQSAAERFDFPLQNAVGMFDSPLHDAEGRFLQQSLTWLPAVSYSGEIWLPAAKCSGEIRLPLYDKRLRRDLTPSCMMQRGVKF